MIVFCLGGDPPALNEDGIVVKEKCVSYAAQRRGLQLCSLLSVIPVTAAAERETNSINRGWSRSREGLRLRGDDR